MKTSRRSFLKTMLAAGAVIGGPMLMQGSRNVFAAQAGDRNLVVFFSWSGNTRAIASRIHKKTGGDLMEIQPVAPYSRDYNTCLDEARRDKEQGRRPELAARIDNLARYDAVFLGYPNWWASIPATVASLLEAHDFSGKVIVPFCSHGGGRLGQSVTDIARLAPHAGIGEALSIHYGGGSSLDRDIDAWLAKAGIGA